MKLQRIKRPLMLAALAAITLDSSRLEAGTHVWSGAINDQWNLPGNWSSGGAPTVAESDASSPIVLIFPADQATRSQTRNNIPGLVVDRLTIERGGYQFSASGAVLRLRGSGTKVWTASSVAIASTTFDSSFRLYVYAQAGFQIGTRHTLVVRSPISGPGGLVKLGTGILELTGSSANTYQGLTRIEAGQIHLHNPPGTLAIPGDLEIGAGITANEDVVRWLADHQLNDARTVSIGPSGWLNLNHHHEAVGAVQLTGGRASSGNGTLTLLGDVVTQASSRSARIEGRLFLGPGAHKFTTAQGNSGGPDLLISAAVTSDGQFPSFEKAGPGSLELSGHNSYHGLTRVTEGWLRVNSATGLGVAESNYGLASGTSVSAGATLDWIVPGAGGEALALAGTGVGGAGALNLQAGGVFSGPVSLTGQTGVRVGNLPSSTFEIVGQIHGSGHLVKMGPGTLRLTGSQANTFTGGATVQQGALVLAKPAGIVSLPGPVTLGDGIGAENDALWLETAGQLPANAAVHIASSGLLTVPSDRNEIIGALTGQGRLIVNGRLSLNVPAGEHPFHGWISGTGELRKSGNGTLVLGGTLTHNRTRITGGAIQLEALANQSRFILAGGVLSGAGNTGPIESQGGLLTPGTSNSGTGVFNTGNLLFNANTTVRLDLNGLIGNSQHDQLISLGAVNLGGARLELQLGFVPPPGSKFLLCLNDGTDPVVGRFAGLPEGAVLAVNGIPLRISYVSGSGANDVVLEVTGEPANDSAVKPSLRSLRPGTMELTAQGQPLQRYRIERSTDLNTWLPLANVQSSEWGEVHFEDPDAPAEAAFYRLLAEDEVAR